MEREIVNRGKIHEIAKDETYTKDSKKQVKVRVYMNRIGKLIYDLY